MGGRGVNACPDGSGHFFPDSNWHFLDFVGGQDSLAKVVGHILRNLYQVHRGICFIAGNGEIGPKTYPKVPV